MRIFHNFYKYYLCYFISFNNAINNSIYNYNNLDIHVINHPLNYNYKSGGSLNYLKIPHILKNTSLYTQQY